MAVSQNFSEMCESIYDRNDEDRRKLKKVLRNNKNREVFLSKFEQLNKEELIALSKTFFSFEEKKLEIEKNFLEDFCEMNIREEKLLENFLFFSSPV